MNGSFLQSVVKEWRSPGVPGLLLSMYYMLTRIYEKARASSRGVLESLGSGLNEGCRSKGLGTVCFFWGLGLGLKVGGWVCNHLKPRKNRLREILNPINTISTLKEP